MLTRSSKASHCPCPFGVYYVLRVQSHISLCAGPVHLGCHDTLNLHG